MLCENAIWTRVAASISNDYNHYTSGTYFIIVQQCIEKQYIKLIALLLNHIINIDTFGVKLDHQFTSCDYKEGLEILQNL